MNINNIICQGQIDEAGDIAHSAGMADNEMEFHNYALRLPKELHKIIEDLAWENRTSVNIQIIDLLVTGMNEILEKDPRSFSMYKEGFDQAIRPVYEANQKALVEYFDRNQTKLGETWYPIVTKYPVWRSKK